MKTTTTTKYPAQLLRQNNENIWQKKKENVEKKSCTAIRPDQKRKTEEADKETKGKKVLHTITTIRRNRFLLFVFWREKKSYTV